MRELRQAGHLPVHVRCGILCLDFEVPASAAILVRDVLFQALDKCKSRRLAHVDPISRKLASAEVFLAFARH